MIAPCDDRSEVREAKYHNRSQQTAIARGDLEEATADSTLRVNAKQRAALFLQLNRKGIVSVTISPQNGEFCFPPTLQRFVALAV